MRQNAVVLANAVLFAFCCRHAETIYCHVGYGQIMIKDSRLVRLWAKTSWVRNCPSSLFCYTARPVGTAAKALEDLLGGDWDDKFWGDGGFIQGCQGDFGLQEGRNGELVFLSRATEDNAETGVHVLDEFPGSGEQWQFKLEQVCHQNLCSSAWSMRSFVSVAPALLLNFILSTRLLRI